MEEHDTYSVAFKRQVVREYFAGVKLYSLARPHNLSLATLRTWVDEHFHRSDGGAGFPDADEDGEGAGATRERGASAAERPDDG